MANTGAPLVCARLERRPGHGLVREPREVEVREREEEPEIHPLDCIPGGVEDEELLGRQQAQRERPVERHGEHLELERADAEREVLLGGDEEDRDVEREEGEESEVLDGQARGRTRPAGQERTRQVCW